jgi:hypothetical protein
MHDDKDFQTHFQFTTLIALLHASPKPLAHPKLSFVDSHKASEGAKYPF